jgi:Xaa-Pro aminopeptidase
MTEEITANKQQQNERLRALREGLAAAKLDGFFVPLADEYMNEYVPPSAQRLAWLTGFTGSAGLGIVLKEGAALFVDGRYTLQAARQVDGKIYEMRHISRQPPSDYLKANLKPNMRIGYDPWLQTREGLEKLRAVIEQAGAKLVAASTNPIDAIWRGRPAAPKAPIAPHPLQFAGDSSAAKREKLAKIMREKSLDAAVIVSSSSIAWLLNVRGGDVESAPLPLSYAILHSSALVDWYVYPEKVSAETHKALGAGIVCHAPDEFLKGLRQLGIEKRRVRVEPHTPSAIYDALSDAGALIDEGVDPCELPKACKNAAEIEGMRAAHVRDGLALTRFLCWLDAHAKGGTLDEMTAQDKLLAFRKENKEFLYPSFNSISGAGPNGAVVHYRASEETNRTLQQNELYLIDSGGQYRDGTTDVTRTVVIGAPSDDMKTHFTLVLKGHIALARACFPQGTTGAQLDVLARQPLWRYGLDYDHGTGHGVGAFLNVHEGPQSISSRSQVSLRAGMVISNEPGYYLEGAYGIRIENLVVVKEAATKMDAQPMLEFETITLAPIDLRLVKAELLETDEKAWLNAYHARVFETHAPRLNAEEKAWLKTATAAI